MTRHNTAAEDLARAEKALARRCRFASARSAVVWYWEARERMSSPKNMYPDHAETYYGEKVPTPRVDGGKGSSMEDVLADIASIGKALGSLKLHDPVGHRMLERVRRDGHKQADVAQDFECSQQAVSKRLWHAESFVLGALADSGLVRPSLD